LTGKRKIVVTIALLFSFLPGLILLVYDLLTNIEGVSPFIMLMVFIVGAPTAFISILTYFFADNKVKRKSILTLILILFQISAIPLFWGINDIKLRIFVYNNQTELELIANNVLDKKWTLEYADEYCKLKNIPANLGGHIESDQTVLFITNGMLSDCHGIAFSRTRNQPTIEKYGNIAYWKPIIDRWYEWASN